MPFVALSTGARTEQHIRKRFREWFDKSGQTQKEAGRPIEWEQQTVSSYFRGDQQIDFVRAITWCKHFGYELEDLLDRAPRTTPADPKLQEWINFYTSQDEERQKELLALGPILGVSRPKKTAGKGRRT